MSRPRKAAAILAALAAAAAMTTGAAAVSSATTAADCGVLFDDFHYDSINDADFQSHGWNARTEAGGPGVPGASWPAGNITFTSADGDQVAQLRASTDGTASGTTHSELRTTQRRFRKGRTRPGSGSRTRR